MRNKDLNEVNPEEGYDLSRTGLQICSAKSNSGLDALWENLSLATVTRANKSKNESNRVGDHTPEAAPGKSFHGQGNQAARKTSGVAKPKQELDCAKMKTSHRHIDRRATWEKSSEEQESKTSPT
jgi:hypothetical protein